MKCVNCGSDIDPTSRPKDGWPIETEGPICLSCLNKELDSYKEFLSHKRMRQFLDSNALVLSAILVVLVGAALVFLLKL